MSRGGGRQAASGSAGAGAGAGAHQDGEVSAFAYQLLCNELVRECDAQDDLAKLEELGFQIGHRFVER